MLGQALMLAATLSLGPTDTRGTGPKLDAPARTPLADAVRTMPLGQNQADWQGEYDQALGRKSSGKKKMLIGAATSVGGALFAGMAAKSCDVDDFLDGDNCEDEADLAWLGYLASVGGSGVLIWGAVEYFDANGDLNRLEMRRPKTSATSIPLSDAVALGVSSGARKAVSVRVAW